jgi:3-hydroxyisobutyrate dehydrogenase
MAIRESPALRLHCMAKSAKIGLVGTGRMGSNMAKRLREVGYPISALYDVQPASAKATAQETGGEATASLARVSELSDIILTVVSDDAAMERIFATAGDSLLQACAGRVFINCATVTPKVHVEVQKRAEERGASSLEACMASSITQARDGTLYLMVAGRESVYRQVEGVLRDISSSLKYVGEAGRAAQVKALVNMVMNINTAGLAEGLGLGDALGLDLAMLREVFSETGANSRVLETDGADMEARDHAVYFSAEHAAKDSGIALSLARDVGLALPLAGASYSQYDLMKSLGLGALDKSGVSELTFLSRHGQRL